MNATNNNFKSLTSAQKTYVLGVLADKVLQSPANYGMQSDGVLRAGDVLDLTDLLQDDEIESLFDKAQKLIAPGSQQERSVLSNDKKIAGWIMQNPGAELSEEKVSEILSFEPKIEEKPLQKPEPEPEKPIQPEAAISSPVLAASPAPAPAPVAAAPAQNGIEEQQIEREIQEAKNRVETLEKGNKLRSMMGDLATAQEVDRAFASEIDAIYGSKGVFGMGRVAGINSKEWGEMARLPAPKVVEYFMGDSTKSGLSPEIVDKLSGSKKHEALLKQMSELMKISNGAVRPYENERMEEFIKRLGGYILRTHLQQQAA